MLRTEGLQFCSGFPVCIICFGHVATVTGIAQVLAETLYFPFFVIFFNEVDISQLYLSQTKGKTKTKKVIKKRLIQPLRK